MGKLSQDEFLARLRDRNSHYAAGEFEVLGEYAGISAPVRCRCLVCGNVWDGNPDSMLRRNSRCPRCGRAAAGKSSGKSRTLTHEKFVRRAADVCPDVEIVGRYAGANTRLAVRCRTCGYSWDAFPATLLRSCSCPCRGRTGRRLGSSASWAPSWESPSWESREAYRPSSGWEHL